MGTNSSAGAVERLESQGCARPEQQVDARGACREARPAAQPGVNRIAAARLASAHRRGPGQGDEQRDSAALDAEHDVRPRGSAAYAALTWRGVTGAGARERRDDIAGDEPCAMSRTTAAPHP